jgi:hypothetical protein
MLIGLHDDVDEGVELVVGCFEVFRHIPECNEKKKGVLPRFY